MKFQALFDFTHNMIKIKGGSFFDSNEVGFNKNDIDFLKNQSKIVSANIKKEMVKPETKKEPEETFDNVENIDVLLNEENEDVVVEHEDSVENEENVENEVDEYTEDFFNAMSKEELDKWAEERGIILDRRRKQDTMIANLLKELNK